jgi:hypothetical protein
MANRKSTVVAHVEAEREAARRYPKTLAERFEGVVESENVRRGLTRTVVGEGDLEGTPAERAIFELLHVIRTEQIALREELERLRRVVDLRGAGASPPRD